MSRKSKQCHGFYTLHEKSKAGFMGTQVVRLGSESHLPFGYCPLSSAPIEDCVVTPSGHLYSREAILEYLLLKTRDIKQQAELFRQQEESKLANSDAKSEEERLNELRNFSESLNGVNSIVQRKEREEREVETESSKLRKRKINETSREQSLDELKRVSPWIVQFTPHAAAAQIQEPPKRPPSPCTGRPLRTKELIPINLLRDNPTDHSGTPGALRFMCPVSRKAITNQKIILLKSTRAYMTEEAAKQLAYPEMVCPTTGKKFVMDDVLELVTAASGFASSGNVIASKYRPSI